MAIDFDADLAYMLRTADFGFAVVFGAQTTAGHYDDATAQELEGPVMGVDTRAKSVLVRTASLAPMAAVGDAVTVAGTAYTVRRVTIEGQDGRETRLWLEDA
jgi:hypothetical protein